MVIESRTHRLMPSHAKLRYLVYILDHVLNAECQPITNRIVTPNRVQLWSRSLNKHGNVIPGVFAMEGVYPGQKKVYQWPREEIYL